MTRYVAHVDEFTSGEIDTLLDKSGVLQRERLEGGRRDVFLISTHPNLRYAYTIYSGNRAALNSDVVVLSAQDFKTMDIKLSLLGE